MGSYRDLSPEEKLIEAIEHELDCGFRMFTIRGAELDTVLAALRAANVSKVSEEQK